MQGHYTPSLGIFHRIIGLEFEAAVLSVVPKLKAMPYWDYTLDAPGVRFGPGRSAYPTCLV